MNTLKEVLAQFHGEAVPDWEAVEAALLVREDNMADIIRLAGMQFGMYPEIVAEVLAQVGIGTPIPDDQRQMVYRNFIALMENLTQQHNEDGGTA